MARTDAHVVHVVESAAGGVRRHVLDLVSGLQDLGFRQTVVFSPTGADPGFHAGMVALTNRDVKFLPCPMAHAVRLSDLISLVRLRRIFARIRPSILHLHSSKAGALGRLATLGRRQCPIVYTPHASGAHLGGLYAVAERVLGWLHIDACIAVSPSEVRDLVRLRVARAATIRQVTNGIDPADVRRRAAVIPTPTAVDVTVCGRITGQKDPLTAARAAAAVVARFPSASFRWVGDGDLRAVFERDLERLGIRSRWEITGWLEDASAYIAASRVLWLPSLYESFGYVTLEAMALGVPTIGTRVAGTSDVIVDGVNGLLVPVGDHGAIAEHTLRLLSDAARCKSISAAARGRADELSASRMVSQTAAVYRSLRDAR